MAESTSSSNKKTSQLYGIDADLPSRFENPDCFQGYDNSNTKKKLNPIYRTTNMVYGSNAPSIHTVPTKFKPRSQVFSSHLASCGMYRNHSLNTHTEKSFITGNPV